MLETTSLCYLKNLWDDARAESIRGNEVALLRYRSNLLGADLRITNFGGGNTSSKIDVLDPFTGETVKVLAVKGSGGDLGSIKEQGFAQLYLDKLEALKRIYRGEQHEDEMVDYYPLAAFGTSKVAASIDTPLHAFLPFAHVDHLHPDWAIGIAASANGKQKLQQFNEEFGRNIIWLHWQRPGFELGVQLADAVQNNPGCDGVLLGSHGLFTWGDSHRSCYLASIETIDQMGQFVEKHRRKAGALFGGWKHDALPNRKDVAAEILPALRGVMSSNKRVIAHYSDHEDALQFAGSEWAEQLGALGTSCPDHFLRTRICPMFVPWDGQTESTDSLKQRIAERASNYRRDYAKYYEAHALADSPKLRDSNPSVVLIPGVGLFGFAKNKKEARISTEFFLNAIHVMAAATALEEGPPAHPYPQSRFPERSQEFASERNYVALPRFEAFRIEYWALEEAKLQRMPAEAEFSRKIVLVVGGGSGIGREVALLLARKGASVVVADLNASAAEQVADEVAAASSKEDVLHVPLNLSEPESIRAAAKATVLAFGGIDAIVNTAAIFPVGSGANGQLTDSQWSATFTINVSGNYFLARELSTLLREQNLPASIVLTSSANAVVPKAGSEAYDISKAACNHLIRELAVGMAPLVRVNGIAPATVVAGSTMFPRDRVQQSLRKYRIEFSDEETAEQLRDKLANFYAQRTLTRRPILPEDCARAIVWLLSDQSAKTTGHVIPVDGGLTEAFLR